jgi:hypothetical protein
LVELLVAALIGAILLAATAGIVVQILRIDREETGRLEVQSEQTLAVDFIASDLAEAIFIYNDTFSAAVRLADPEDPAQFTTPDGIPDLNQLLYDPGWIKRPPDSIPVLAFWKFEPIPQNCFVGPPNLEQIARGDGILRPTPAPPPAPAPAPPLLSIQDWQNLTNRRSIYVLVVYYLRRNNNDDGNVAGGTGFEGNARITRYELRPIDNNCNNRNLFFNRDPDPFDSTFLEWPDPTSGQIPAQPNDASDPRTLVSNVFSTRLNAEFSVQRDPVDPLPVPVNLTTCSRFGLDPNGLPEFTLAGVKPFPPAPTTIPAPLQPGDADRGFYACVRRTPNANQPQDVILNFTSTALERANIGLFNRYISDTNSLDPQILSGYLNTIETRVLSRGALSRSVS